RADARRPDLARAPATDAVRLARHGPRRPAAGLHAGTRVARLGGAALLDRRAPRAAPGDGRRRRRRDAAARAADDGAASRAGAADRRRPFERRVGVRAEEYDRPAVETDRLQTSVCHVIHEGGWDRIHFDDVQIERLLARGEFFWLDLDNPDADDFRILRERS